MRKTLTETPSVGAAVQLCDALKKKFLEDFKKSPKIELLVFMSSQIGVTIQWKPGQENEVEWFENQVLNNN